MKTSIVHYPLSILTLCFLLPVLLSACTARKPHYTIGVSQCLDDAWRQKMNYEMEREMLLYPDLTLTRRIAYGSNDLQCAQIDSFIAERVNLLIVSPNEAEEVKPAVNRAFRAGIPVIVADRRVTGDEWTAFIGGDNYKVGLLMAEWVSERFAGRKEKSQSAPFTVLEVAGLPGSTPATLRHKGLMEGLDRISSSVVVHSVMGSWYQDDAEKVVADYLRSHPLPDAVVAHNDLMAIGAAQAVRNSRKTETNSRIQPAPAIPIMGVDGIRPGLQAIVDGQIECSATYSSRGDLVIQTAAHILHGEPFVRDTVLETTMIDEKAAYPMLKQYEAIMRDLQTFHIIQTQTESRWQQLRMDNKILWLCVVISGAFLLIALAYILFAQRRLQTEISHEILPQLENVQEAIQLSRRDEAFAERLRQVVDEHLTDPNLSVEYLGSMLQLSRTQLFRRVKTVAGKGPLDYIRERRLIRADEMLHTTDMTIQQVAIELCFTSPGYFSKCYKDYFGHLPSER